MLLKGQSTILQAPKPDSLCAENTIGDMESHMEPKILVSETNILLQIMGHTLIILKFGTLED